MNKHICKAKRVDNGGWVEGLISYIDESHCLIHKNEKGFCSFVAQNNTRMITQPSIEVDPNTVCRYTGKENVFEGDYFISEDYDDAYCIISYNEEYFTWEVGVCDERVCIMNKDTPIGFGEPLSEWNGAILNILGNIYDSEVTNE